MKNWLASMPTNPNKHGSLSLRGMLNEGIPGEKTDEKGKRVFGSISDSTRKEIDRELKRRSRHGISARRRAHA